MPCRCKGRRARAACWLGTAATGPRRETALSSGRRQSQLGGPAAPRPEASLACSGAREPRRVCPSAARRWRLDRHRARGTWSPAVGAASAQRGALIVLPRAGLGLGGRRGWTRSLRERDVPSAFLPSAASASAQPGGGGSVRPGASFPGGQAGLLEGSAGVEKSAAAGLGRGHPGGIARRRQDNVSATRPRV